MKTQLLVLTLMTSVFATQMQGQNRTIVNATSSEISDNLDLRVVASIFGDSKNLQDFERQLNDPKLQISNLDLNNDNQVDYLRVIESMQNRTHVIIIQSVLDRDLYQDVATIEVEKNRNNTIHIQVVGNSYFYGQNYIYEPVYHITPSIYTNFWMSNYRPYYSAWSWNYYPSYYYAWNPFPVFRYRNNVNVCLNNYSNNHYNYVNYRRSSCAASIYNSRRSFGYERLHPDYSFSRRNSKVNNRYELDQIRNTRNVGSSNDVGYTRNRTTVPQRDYSQNRVETPRQSAPQREYSQNRIETPRQSASQREYSQNRVETPRQSAPQREYSQNRVETPRQSASQREYSQNRVETPRQSAPQRDYSQNRVETPRQSAPQRSESSRENTQSRNSSSGATVNSSRNNNRRT